MNVDEAQTFFVDGEYRSGAEVRAIFSTSLMADRQERCLRLLEGNRIVDIGCYAGTFVRRAKRLYPESEVIGVDYDEENLRIARFLNGDDAVALRKMSVYALEFPDSSVDCVVFQEVIEHVEDAAQAVKEINRVLKPGGAFVLTTPNAYYWRHFAQHLRAETANAWRSRKGGRRQLSSLIFFDNVEWNRHIYCWTPATLLTLMEVNGFTYEHHEYSLDDVGLLGRIVGRCVPALGNTIVLKVRKTSVAPSRIV